MLYAFNPWYGISFLIHHGIIGFFTLGAVFLVVTGVGSALRGSGAFRPWPDPPCLARRRAAVADDQLSGTGRAGARESESDRQPILSTISRLGADPDGGACDNRDCDRESAVITGAYSLTRQAIGLGLLPRLEVRHTSEALAGQIYMPAINWLLLIGVLLLVALFRSSSNLASAYGIAVTGTMVVTAMMAFVVIWRVWRWPIWGAAALIAPFLFVDLTFLTANLLKVIEGGWIPLVLGAVIMGIMYTWRRGSRLLVQKTRRQEVPLSGLVSNLERKMPHTVPGTAVFLTADPEFAPTALLHSLKHYKVLHEKNVILTIETADTPRVDPSERVRMEPIGQTFSRVTLRFGFMETPNVPRALAIARKLGWQFDIMSTSFFLSRRSLRPAADFRYGEMAGPAIHHTDAGRQRRDKLFPNPHRPCGRGRDAGHDLIKADLPKSHRAL